MHIPDWTTERRFWSKQIKLVAGVDEAGRGPLAGPVVACAALRRGALESSEAFSVQEDDLWDIVRDSKTLSASQRDKAYEFVEREFFLGIGIISPDTIDRINILQASFLAMKEAINTLSRTVQGSMNKISELYFLVDGNSPISNCSIQQKCIPKGDRRVKSIAAASIAAKVTRDRIVGEYEKEYPQYGFAKHKGYGTKAHMEALKKYGPTPMHRRSFGPVKDCIKELRSYGLEIS